MQLVLVQQLRKFKFNQENDKIERDVSLSDKQKSCKVKAVKKRILRDEVNAKAKELTTCCIHYEPLGSAFWDGLCALHFSTNEFRRFLDKLEAIAVQSTFHRIQYFLSNSRKALKMQRFVSSCQT